MEAGTRPAARRQTHPLGLWTLAALVVANMIGAGVFTMSGFALGDLGSPLRVLAAWFVGGLLALCGALSYGMLARLVPASGGEYLYLSRNLHPGAGFIAGWVSLLAGFVGAIAYAAITFSVYAAPVASDSYASQWIATSVIVAAAMLHAFRLREGASVQNLAVALKLVLIGAFCAYAVGTGGGGGWPGLTEGGERADLVPAFSIGAFALTLMWISFSYSGFNAAVYVAGEVPVAKKLVPCGLLLGTFVTMLVYLALNAVFVLAAPFETIAFQEDVAAAAAGVIGGDRLAVVVRVVIAVALFTSVSAMTMVGPRVYARMADDGLLPRALRLKGETPMVSVLMQSALAIVVVWIAGLRELLSYLGFTLALCAAATVATLFVVARRQPGIVGCLPGYPWAPLAYVGFTLLFAALAATQSPWEMVAAVATLVSGLLLYALARRSSAT